MNEAPACHYCRQPRVLKVFEFWPEERAFMLETCCEAYEDAMREELCDPELHAEKEWRRGFCDWFKAETGFDVRRLYPSEREGALRLDYGLTLEASAPRAKVTDREITRDEAKAFVREHHEHNDPPAGWKWGHALYNGSDVIAVAMVGRPVSKALDDGTRVEVNRVCVRRDIDPELAWNACSMLYGAAAREAKARGFQTILTYTLESEAGTTLKAAGWTPVATTKGGSWNRPSRPREDKAPTCKKIRWERELVALRKAAA